MSLCFLFFPLQNKKTAKRKDIRKKTTTDQAITPAKVVENRQKLVLTSSNILEIYLLSVSPCAIHFTYVDLFCRVAAALFIYNFHLALSLFLSYVRLNVFRR